MATPTSLQATGPTRQYPNPTYPAKFLHSAIAEVLESKDELSPFVDLKALEKIEASITEIDPDELIPMGALLTRAKQVNSDHVGPCLRHVLCAINFLAWRRFKRATGTGTSFTASGRVLCAKRVQQRILRHLPWITAMAMEAELLRPPKPDDHCEVAKFLFTMYFRLDGGAEAAKFTRLKFIGQEFEELKGLFPRVARDPKFPLNSDGLRKCFLAMPDLFIVGGPENDWHVKATEDHSRNIKAIMEYLLPVPKLGRQKVVNYLRSVEFWAHNQALLHDTQKPEKERGLSGPDLQKHIHEHFKLEKEMFGQVRDLLERLRKDEKVWSFNNGKVSVPDPRQAPAA